MLEPWFEVSGIVAIVGLIGAVYKNLSDKIDKSQTIVDCKANQSLVRQELESGFKNTALQIASFRELTEQRFNNIEKVLDK